MSILKLIRITLLLFITYITVINSQESDYEIPLDNSDYQLDNNSSLAVNQSANGTDGDIGYDVDGDYEDDDGGDDEDDEECSVDEFVDHYSQLLMPDDYEEGKKLDFTQKSFTFSESIVKFKRLDQFQKNVTKKLDPIMKRVAPRLSEFLFYIDLPSDCMTALARVGQAIRAQETWAFRFLDSSPIGKMDLTSLPFGEYDECLDIESRYQWDKPMIYGQYCALGLPLSIIPPSGSHTAEDNRRNDAMLLNYMRQRANSTEERTPQKDFMDRLNNETDGHLMEGLMRYIEYLGEEEVRLPPGICLPTACNAKDFEFAINKILYPFTHFSISINPDCDYKDKPISIDKYQITSIVMLSLMGTICIICTIIYLIRSTETSDKPVADGKPTARVFQVTDCFAIVPNFVSIFDMRSKPNRLSAVDGVRAVLCFWMFIQHEYDMGYLPFQHKRTSQSAPYDFHTSLRYIFLINWNLTDTFFLMAGFLCSYVMITKLDKRRAFDYFSYALYRYFRILPIILTAIAITFIIELIGDGPLWPLISHILQKPCIESPMSTIFMVNNYISFPNLVTCVPATWYASTYFQLCLLAPFVVLILYYAPTIGILWSLVVISFGSFLSISPKLIAGIPHFFESYKSLSIDTVVSSVGHHLWGIETHVQLYVLGLLFGYLTKRHPNMYLGGIFGELAIWLTTWAMTFYAIFWHRNYFNFEEYSVTESEITHWILWSKLCYGAGWAWLFYACSTGRAGFINSFFSWKGFKPFSHLMLEIYMLHLFVLIYRIGTIRERIFYSNYYVWTVIIFDYILAFILSVIVNVFVTKPLANVLNLVYKVDKTRDIFDENNNNWQQNGKEVLPLDAVNDDKEVVVFTNSAFDGDNDIIAKVVNTETLINNNSNNNNVVNNTNDANVV